MWEEAGMFSHEKRPLSYNGVYIDCVRTDRFRFASFSLTFFLGELDFKKRQALYALSRMMENGSREYPTPESLDIALSMLYDAEISFTFTESESGVFLHAEADFADTPSVGVGEGLLWRILSHVKNTVGSPFPEADGGEALLSRVKEEIRGDSSALISDHDSYAYSIYKDKVYSHVADRLTTEGIRNIPDEVSLFDVVSVHRTVAGAPLCYAFYVGRSSADTVCGHVKEFFGDFSPARVTPFSLGRGYLLRDREGPVGTSTRMHLGFSYSCTDVEANVLAQYLGGVPISRFFTELRERNRYCYSVYAERSSMGLFTVGATVGAKYEEKARALILDVIDEACYDCTQAVLFAARDASLIAARYIYENRRACERFFFSAFVKGERADIEERIRQIRSFNRDSLMRAARSLTLRADYVLFGKGDPPPKGYSKEVWRL